MKGYNGRILRVDLTTGESSVETPGESFYRRYAGGRNFGAYYLLREVPAGIDPLSPANKLVFAVGPLTGSSLSGSSRSSAMAKSPLTGGWGEAEAGGFWPAEFKAAGFDALILEGRCPKPSYLWIHDGAMEIRPAGDIWGQPTKDAQAAIQADVDDPRARVALIGVAGENLVRYACILNDVTHAYGRTGLGAVVGSKLLKGVAVRGTHRLETADPQAVRDLTLEFNRAIGEHPGLGPLQKLGTSKGIMQMDAAGLLPTQNFRGGTFEDAEALAGKRMHETIVVKKHGCYSCAVRCKRAVAYVGPEFSVDPAYGSPEYETTAAFGSGCMIGDINVVAKANELCDKYGMDTISCALTIACAMECFEHGLLNEQDTDGLDLRFGNGDALLECVEKAAHRQGFGDRLAEGSRRLSEDIGGDAPRFAMHVKGQELPSHQVAGKWGVALGYAVSPTGADHLVAAHDQWFELDADPETSPISLTDIRPMGIVDPVPAMSLGPDKVRLFATLQNAWSLINVIDFCLFCMTPEFSIYSLDQIVQAVRAVTGWNVSLAELLTWGERGIALARAFNAREGMGAKDDWLPDRLFEPLESGAFAGACVPRKELAGAIKLYYQMQGWDDEGRPTPAKLHALDLGWVIPLLYEDPR